MPNNDIDFGRIEERLTQLSERFVDASRHQEKMWVRIDEVLEKMIRLETVIENSELKKMGRLQERILILENWKNSVWRTFQPAVSAITGGAVLYAFFKIFGVNLHNF